MRILFIIAIDRSRNGPSVHLLNDIINAVKRRGHIVTTIEKRFSIEKDAIEQVDERETRYLLGCREPKKNNFVQRYLADLRYVKRCRAVARKWRFDAAFLQSNTHAGFQMAWLKRTPTLFNVQDIFPLDAYYEGLLGKTSLVYRVLASTQAYAYRKAAKVITISEDMRATLCEIGVPEEKVSVVYNWQYQAESCEEDRKEVCKTFFQDGAFHVVYAGNIGMAQDVETLVRAAARLKDDPQIVTTIVGDGAKKNACKEIAKEMEINNIRFFDAVPQRYARYLYENADVNIVTLVKGISRTSLPSKTAACYDSGKPVIYCVEKDCQTLQKMMAANPQVYQCDPSDPKALADRIMQIKTESPQRKQHPSYSEVLQPQSPDEYAVLLEQCAVSAQSATEKC